MEQYTVTGMSCAACSARVEKAVKAVPGVTSCSVSLLTNSMGVEGTAEDAAIIHAVEQAGYGASPKKAAAAASPSAELAALAGEVQAMIALGDDCAASGGEMAETLQYYRRAQSAAREVPDIAYTPQVCLRLAQYETQYLSRKKALLQVAEAVQGFRILQA